VILVKEATGGADVQPFFGGSIPRQFEAGIQVVPQKGCLSRAGGLTAETGDLF
jgi:hypothetical protein